MGCGWKKNGIRNEKLVAIIPPSWRRRRLGWRVRKRIGWGERRGVDSIRASSRFRLPALCDVRERRPPIYGVEKPEPKRISLCNTPRATELVPFRAFPSAGQSEIRLPGLPSASCRSSSLCTITSDCALLLSWHEGGAVSFISSEKNPESLNVYPCSKPGARGKHGKAATPTAAEGERLRLGKCAFPFERVGHRHRFEVASWGKGSFKGSLSCPRPRLLRYFATPQRYTRFMLAQYYR